MKRRILSAAAAVLLLAIVWLPMSVGRWSAGATTTGPCITWAGQCRFPASIDTMKLSKDKESAGLTDAQIVNVVANSALPGTTHIAIDTHYDHPDVMYQWVKAVRAQGRHVWFRAGIEGWTSGTITPSQWLQTYENWLRTYVSNPGYPGFFQKGDIFDPNPETENGYVVYCQCSLYGGTSWTTAFNQFLIDQTTIADQVFTAKGFNQSPANRDILTTVHSVDPGTAVGVLNGAFMASVNNLVTLDAYPDQNDTDAAQAAFDWSLQLGKIHEAWPQASVLIGEMGYSNTINVNDSQQQAVIAAEMQAFWTTTFPLVGINYWVGPGSSAAGGYTYLLQGSIVAGWAPRPAAACLSAFFTQKQGGAAVLCASAAGTVTPTSVGGSAQLPGGPADPAGVAHQPHDGDPPWRDLAWVGVGAVSLFVALELTAWLVARVRQSRRY